MDAEPEQRNPSVEEVNAALTNSGGNRKVAAEALGITGTKLKEKINNNVSLKVLWGNVQVDDDDGSDQKVTMAVMAGMGLTRSEVGRAISFQRFSTLCLDQQSEILNGGLVAAMLKLNAQMEVWQTQLNNGFDSGGEEDDGGMTALMKEKLITEAYLRAADVLRKMTETINDSTLKRSQLKLREKEIAAGSGRKGAKPGFGHLVRREPETIVEAKQ